MSESHHWSYTEWEDVTVAKIVRRGLSVPDDVRADYLTVQIRLAIKQALRHGRSGRSDDDPVTS